MGGFDPPGPGAPANAERPHDGPETVVGVSDADLVLPLGAAKEA